MITSVLMPKLGETDAVSFTIEKWLHNEGDSVRKGQSLLVVATDKTSLEVEARAGGTLRRILFKESESVTVGTVIALIGPAKAALSRQMCERKLAPAVSSAAATSANRPATTPGAAETAPRRMETRETQFPPSPVNLPREGPPRMSPRARRRALELKVPLQALPMPGDGRRITDREVLAAAASIDAVEATPAARAAAFVKGLVPHSVSSLENDRPRLRLADVDSLHETPLRVAAERTPLSPLRRAVAENMAYAQQFIPQFSIDMLVLAAPLLEWRKTLQRDWGRREAPSIDDLFIRALSLVLREELFKPFRAVLDGYDAIYRGEINLAFAVALENQGVIAPVVKCADRLSLREIARTTRELIAKARNKHLSHAENSGGLMTISNLGMRPVHSFRAIVRPGESAILAIPSPQPRLVYQGEMQTDRPPEVTVAPTWQLSLSADHRLVDGALAAEFLSKLKTIVECPERLI